MDVHEWLKTLILAVSFPPENTSVRLAATGCLTPFGDTEATFGALLRGERALRPTPVLGADGGDAVPLALCPGHALNETAPPSWLPILGQLADKIPSDGWGSPRRPVFVTSSNFGVGSLHAFRRTHDTAHLAFATPSATVGLLQAHFGWGANVALLSHACVSAHLGLLLATRTLHAGLADEALVFSFDFLSPFVTGGFHALKILNADFPAPYQNREAGAIGLGDGAAFAVLTRERGDFVLLAQSLHNEMHHFTANQPDGAGFAACLAPLAAAAGRRRPWLKGHGTGTIEARARLEARRACARVSRRAAGLMERQPRPHARQLRPRRARASGRRTARRPHTRHHRQHRAGIHRCRRAGKFLQPQLRYRSLRQQRLRRRACRTAPGRLLKNHA